MSEHEMLPPDEEKAPFTYSHSSGFAEALQTLGAALLVTTYQAGKLAAFRSADGLLSMLPRTFDQAMGLAADPAHLSIATRYQIWLLRNQPRLA